MALRGTLSDFGIADIFQLVGHQTKTGVLLLKNRENEVRIYFVDGNVVKAEQASRDKADLLGNIMVRAGVLSESDLEEALTAQQRTMRRLGDVLIESRLLTLDTLKEFTRLQTTETIYRLFLWDAGTYEFSQQEDFDYDPKTQAPIRAEEILMEAFRMVDEWPAVREVVPSSQMTVKKLKELPADASPAASDDDDLMSGLDDAFGEFEEGGGGKDDDDAEIGRNERTVFALIKRPDITVQELVDRSRLGEFETCKALAGLIKGGFVEGELPPDAVLDGPRLHISPRAVLAAAPALLTRIALYAVVAAAVGGVIKLYELDESSVFARDRALVVRPGQVLQQLGAVQKARLVRAIEVYRLLEGAYPDGLDALVERGLATEDDLRRPFEGRFSYRRTPAGYALALPLR